MDRALLAGLLLPVVTALILLGSQYIAAGAIASRALNDTIAVIWYDGTTYSAAFYEPGIGLYTATPCYGPGQPHTNTTVAGPCGFIPSLLQGMPARLVLVLYDGNTTTPEKLARHPVRLATSAPQPLAGLASAVLLYKRRYSLPAIVTPAIIGFVTGLALYAFFEAMISHMIAGTLGLTL